MDKILKRDRAEDEYYDNSFKPSLEVLQAKNWNNEKHRELRVEFDPIINALVVRVAKLMTERSPIFLDSEGNEMNDLKESWDKNNYNDLLKDVIITTRTHGYNVVEWLKTPVDDRSWLIHSDDDMIMITYEKFNLIKYTVLPKIETGNKVALQSIVSQYDLFPEDVIHFYLGRHKLNKLGFSPIKPIWDAAVRYMEMLEAMALYDSRIGNGMMVVSVDPKSYVNKSNKLANSIANTNTKRFLILKNSLDGRSPAIQWEGSTNRIEWDRDLEEILKVICGNTGFPVRWFIGDPKGAQSAAKEDRIAIWTTLKSIFEEYIPFIRKVLLHQENGEAINEKVVDIIFDDGANLEDESFNAEVDQNTSQTSWQ